jgi:hypothetical protein
MQSDKGQVKRLALNGIHASDLQAAIRLRGIADDSLRQRQQMVSGV